MASVGAVHSQLEEITVEKGELQFDLVQVDVLEVGREMTALVVEHQEHVKAPNRVGGVHCLQFLPHALRRDVSQGLGHGGWRTLRTTRAR